MPNWKKVIVSGSDAALNSLNVSTSFTASGNIYPTGLGIDRQVIKTDGAGNLTFGYSEEIVAVVKNVSGVILQKGTPVHATGSLSLGNVVGVIAALASDPTTMPATFVLNETLTNGSEGEALASGFIQGVNTNLFEVGQIIYVGAMGGYTGTKPTGSNLVQNLGIVTKVHLSNGSGFILGAGRSNDLPNIQPGYAWVGNSDSVPTAISTSSIQNVVSSSFAQTASFISSTFISASAAASGFGSGGGGGSTFPFTGSAIISGSLEITGSLLVQDISGIETIDSETRRLYDSSGNRSISWGGRTLGTSTNAQAAGWDYPNLTQAIEFQAYTRNNIDMTSVAENFADFPTYQSFQPQGEILKNGVTFDAAVADFDLVYLETDNTWYPVNGATTGSQKMLGVAFGIANFDNQVLIEGTMVVNDGTYSDTPVAVSVDYGLPIFIRTVGATYMSTSAPGSSGDTVRILGHCYYNSANSGTYWIMKFRPSNDFKVL